MAVTTLFCFLRVARMQVADFSAGWTGGWYFCHEITFHIKAKSSLPEQFQTGSVFGLGLCGGWLSSGLEIGQKLRFINRQPESGIRIRVDNMIVEEGVEKEKIKGYDEEVNTHFNVGSAVLSGKADVGVAAETVSRYFNLKFSKLFEERFDMVVYKDSYFEENIQIFIEFIKSKTFLELLATMAGYSSRQTGKVLYPNNQTSEGEPE